MRILQLMWVQQRYIIKLSVLIQMNSRTSSYILGISCIFLVSGKFLSNSRFEEILYQARTCSVGGIRPFLSGKSLQDVLKNSQHCALGYQPSRCLKNTLSLFFAKSPLNLQTVQAPLFRKFPLHIGFSCILGIDNVQ